MANKNLWLRIACGAAAAVLVAPVDLLWFGGLDSVLPWTHANVGTMLVAMFALTILGFIGLRWALHSWSGAALLASVLNLPLAFYFATPEAGEWAGLYGFPRYILFLLAGLFGLREKVRRGLRWSGVVAPIACMALPFIVQATGLMGK